MKNIDKHRLAAIKSFVDAGYLDHELKTLQRLERHLSMCIMEKHIDMSTYDDFLWLIHRIEALVQDLKIAENTVQTFRDRHN